MDAGKAEVSFVLGFPDREISVSVALPLAPVTLTEMLPVFQGLADAIVSLAKARAADAGLAVICRMGCAHCCRQLVPIAEPEVRNLAEIVAAMPPVRRRRTRDRFAAAVAHAERAGLGEAMRSAQQLDEERYCALSYAYHDLGIECPFLQDDLCSIYRERPLQCREYLMLSPPDNCRRPRPETVTALAVPFRASKALFRLGIGGPRWIPLALALEWAGNHPEGQPHAAPAAEILRRFLDILQTT